MDEKERVIRYILHSFRELHGELSKIFAEERAIHDRIMVKRGFILHAYSLKYESVDHEQLDTIVQEIENLLTKEDELYRQVYGKKKLLEAVAEDYMKMYHKQLPVNLVWEYLKRVIHEVGVFATRCKQLQTLLQETGGKLHSKRLPKHTELFFASIEHLGTEIIRFVVFLEQLLEKIIAFEETAYYPEPHQYGRAMGVKEFKKTLEEGKLSSSKDPTPVFDAPRAVVERILRMPPDKRKNYFDQIGVVGGAKVIFFQTKLKPVNARSPIRQSNGLREFKFPKGVAVKVTKAA